MAIFVQSCPFSCLYCHNPETINLCNNCGKCVDVCPKKALSIDNEKKVIWNKEKCVNCDNCIKKCPNLSSPKVMWMSIEELLNEIKKVKPFIRGITVSGGECTTYPEFLLALFKEVHKLNLTCLLDSNGAFDYENMEDLIKESDGVMLDIKAIDPTFHKSICGLNNNIVLKNLKYLLSIKKVEEVRTVILPNENENNIKTVSEVSKIIKDKTRYKLLKYRYFGVRKEGIDRFKKVIVDDKTLLSLKEVANKNGATNVVII